VSDATAMPDEAATPDAAAMPDRAPMPGEAALGARRRRSRRRHGRGRRAALLALVALAALGAIGALLAATRYLPALDAARALQAQATELTASARAAGLGIDRAQVTAIEAQLATARTELDRVEGLLRDDPLVALARALPPTRDAVSGADGIAAASDALLGAAGRAVSLADRYVAIKERQTASAQGESTLAELVELLATSRDDLLAMQAGLDKAQGALAATPAHLPGELARVRDQLSARVADYGPAVDGLVRAQGVLPGIMGWGAPRRYLVLTQDAAELRPTGGFIGSFGTIALDAGRITERKFQDVFRLDLPWDYPFVTPPVALERYLLGPKQPWQLADANWSPDFPTSAQQAVALYANEGGPGPVDGVLAITTHTIDEILAVTGPVTVPDYGVTIASGETTLKVLQNTRRPSPGSTDRKAFLSDFAGVLFARLFALPPAKWLDLAARSDAFRDGRLLQAWFADPAAEAEATALGLDGRVRQDAGDYVYPVDSNVAPASKLNAVTTRSLELTATLDEVGNAHDELAVTWHNAIESPAAAPYRALPDVGASRDLGMYFRLLVPERSVLTRVGGGSRPALTAPADIDEEAGRTAFANYLRVPPGDTTVRYAWTSPYAADLGADGVFTYYLTVQRQPGLLAGPIAISIALPPGATVVDSSAGLGLHGGTLSASVPLDRDLVVAVRYRIGAGGTP